jgi:hypothetical protein
MRSPRTPLASALVAVGVLAVSATAADARTVRFAPGSGSTLSDRGIHCNVGESASGRGSVTCTGTRVWQRWEKQARCGDDGPGLVAIRLRESGRSFRDEFCGAGGKESSERGDTIVAGSIRGRHLAGGGFTFRNEDGHGFTLTAGRLRTF